MSNDTLSRGRIARALRRFARAKRGNVAMIFALSLIPIAIAAGAGLDFARAIVVRASMSEAIDAAALAVGGSQGLTNAQMQTLAQQYFNANYKADASYGTPAAITVVPGTSSVVITASDVMPTTLLSAVGIKTVPISVNTKVVWGQMKLWVSLVLDNTGSMCEPDNNSCPGDNNPNIKINALKTATKSLLTMLQNASSVAGDVQVAIVPFAKDVNIGSGNYNASWLDWTSWDAANGSCNISGINNQSTCQSTSGTWNNSRCNISGYNTRSSCQNAKGTWTVQHSTWNGCIMDRNQDYDTMDTSPTSTTTNFPPEQYNACPEAILPLGYNWTTLNSEVDGMVANGGTNQTIGLEWGWQAMTQGNPLPPPALPPNTQRVIILLSDGLNTQDRWYGNGSSQSSQVDSRMSAACTNAKADGITIYAVFVDLNGTQGNSTVLQNCATDASKYFDLTSAGQIVDTFNQIGQQITNLRVSQ